MLYIPVLYEYDFASDPSKFPDTVNKENLTHNFFLLSPKKQNCCSFTYYI
jgi:hypothetical protein